MIFVFIAAHKGLKIRANEPGELRVWVEVVLSCASVGVAIVQMFNVVHSDPRGAPYVAGILVLLGLSGLQFVVLAVDSISRER